MNREILFRGKRTDNGKWVYGFFNGQSILEYRNDKGIITRADKNTHAIMRPYPIDIETLGQYTSLTDKNGKKIFEGDIFKFKDEVWESCYTSCGTEYDSWEVENYGVVGFDEDTGRFDFIEYKYNENSVEADLHENHDIEFSDFVDTLEVIGNIYDNPELLEVQNDTRI